MNQPRTRIAVVLVIFAAVYLALTVGSYRNESATVDEPQHLVAGYAMLRAHDYRIDPEHPPFLRMWAALPLLAMREIKLDTNSPYWHTADQWRFCHQFLFQDNDADRLLFRARFMVALLGVLLGVLVFAWARQLFGFWPAVIVLGLDCTEPNLLAHSGLVTTDLGATCFSFGAVYFAWRIGREFNVGNLVGLAVFFALAQVSKYSALLLCPILLALLFVRALNPAPWSWKLGQPKLITGRVSKGLMAALTFAGVLVISYAALWAVYAFRYAPTTAGIERAQFVVSDEAQRRLPHLTRFMQWADEHRLVPNACAQGFTSMALTTQQRSAYLLGEFSDRGWWYYFPLAFLIKTPVALLAMAVIGLALCPTSRTTTRVDALFVLGPPVVYFGVAMGGHLDIGLRHILVVYPFVLLLAGWTITALWPSSASRHWRPWRGLVLAVFCSIQLAEFAAIYPYCLAFFNASVGGARHGADYLVDSNLDWGQGLKLLNRWMTENRVQHINLSYFGTADPAYYGIKYTPLPGAPFFDRSRIARPRLPGYVAVSATNLRGAYLSDFGKDLYAPLREQKPAAVLGYCIYVYWMERPWW